jgi:hypothetical protein
MTIDPNANYYQPSMGSITGFDNLTITQTNTPVPTLGWSVDQLRQFLLNPDEQNFPSRDWVFNVDQDISHHLVDFNNPHNVTIDQLTNDFIKNIMSKLVPGTLPSGPAIVSYDAACEIPLETTEYITDESGVVITTENGENIETESSFVGLFPGSAISTNMYRLNISDQFVYSQTAFDHSMVDYTIGKAGIPLFPSYTAVAPTTWGSDTTTRLNTLLTTSVIPTSLLAPFPLYDVFETSMIGEFGLNLPVTQVAGMTYYTCFYIVPTDNTGTLRINHPNNTTDFALVSLLDGSVIRSSSNVLISAAKYTSGIVRVGFGFKSPVGNAATSIKLTYAPFGQSSYTRTGVDAQLMFSIGGLSTSTALVERPHLVNQTLPATNGQFIVDMTKIVQNTLISLNAATISVSTYMSDLLSGTDLGNPTIMTFGPLSLVRGNTQINVLVSGTPIGSIPFVPGSNTYAISYSPTTIIIKDSHSDRQTFTGTYPLLPLGSLYFEKFSGYLLGFEIYAGQDTALTLEYLTNG